MKTYANVMVFAAAGLALSGCVDVTRVGWTVEVNGQSYDIYRHDYVEQSSLSSGEDYFFVYLNGERVICDNSARFDAESGASAGYYEDRCREALERRLRGTNFTGSDEDNREPPEEAS